MTRKSRKYSFRLSKNKTINIDIKFPEIYIQTLELLTMLLVGVYLLFIFSSYILKITESAALDIEIWTYIFVLLLVFLQISKLLLGGGRFFPKVTYDIWILLIPPFLIISTLISSTENKNIFGNENSWAIAPISILSAILAAYLIAMNFSNKKGEKFFSDIFDFGLILGAAVHLIVTLGFGDLPQNNIAFDYLMLLVAPAYILRLFGSTTMKDKIKIFLVVIFAAVFVGLRIDEMYSLLDNQFYRLNFRPPVVAFILAYDLLILIFTVGFLKKINFGLITYLKTLNKTVDKSLKGNIKSDFKTLITKSYREITAFLSVLFFVTNIAWLIIGGFLEGFIKNVAKSWEAFNDVSDLKDIIFGKGLTFSSNHMITMIQSYGVINFIIFTLILSYIMFSLIKNLKKQKDIFDGNQLFIVINLFMFCVISFIFNFTTILVVTFWMIISFAMIVNREEEIISSDYTLINFKSFKNKNHILILKVLRSLVMILVTAFVIAVIWGIFDFISRGVFFSTSVNL